MDFARWLLVLVLAFFWPETYSPWTGEVLEVIRADEIKVEREGRPENIRLYGVDCPIEPQTFGKKAKEYTINRVIGKRVLVQPLPAPAPGREKRFELRARDQYNRIIALVWIDGVSLNKELVRKGIGWWFRKRVPFERGLDSTLHR
jgi:endonuclease YncB( thermonuclease family)